MNFNLGVTSTMNFPMPAEASVVIGLDENGAHHVLAVCNEEDTAEFIRDAAINHEEGFESAFIIHGIPTYRTTNEFTRDNEDYHPYVVQ